jgi:hypothetical protein
MVESQSECMAQPFLEITALDTKSGGWVTAIHIKGLGDKETVCKNDRCEAPLPETEGNVKIVTYWATSSLGDNSSPYTLAIRAEQKSTGRSDYWQIDAAGGGSDGFDAVGKELRAIWQHSQLQRPRKHDLWV